MSAMTNHREGQPHWTGATRPRHPFAPAWLHPGVLVPREQVPSVDGRALGTRCDPRSSIGFPGTSDRMPSRWVHAPASDQEPAGPIRGNAPHPPAATVFGPRPTNMIPTGAPPLHETRSLDRARRTQLHERLGWSTSASASASDGNGNGNGIGHCRRHLDAAFA